MEAQNSEYILNSFEASLDKLAHAIVVAACEKALAKLNAGAIKPSVVNKKPQIWLAHDVDSAISGLRQISEGGTVALQEIKNDQNIDLDVLINFLTKDQDCTQQH